MVSAARRSTALRWRECLRAAAERLLNVYGPDRGTTVCDVAPAWRRVGARRAADADRPADREHARLYVLDRQLQPVPVGVPASSTSAATAWRAGYLEPAGADGRALRARPVRGGAGGAAVPHGRPGALAADGALEFLGRRRPPGEDPRLPHRAGRDRGGAGAHTRRCARRWCSRARTRRATGGWSPTWCRRTAPRSTSSALRGAPARAAARLHGARRRSSARRAAAHAQRQGGPAAPCRRRRRRRRGSRRTWRRATPIEELLAAIWAEVLGVEQVGVARQLLRARRALAAGDPGDLAPARGASASSCRCARCSRPRRWRRWRRAVEQRLGSAGSRAAAASCRCRATEAAAAVVRPAAALVPRPARAGQPALQHPGGAAAAGPLDAAALRAEPRRDRAPARGRCARAFVPSGRRARAGDRPGGARRAAGGRPGRLPAGGARGAARGRSPRPRRAGRSTSARVRCCAARCCGWRAEEHVLSADHAPHRRATAGRWAC